MARKEWPDDAPVAMVCGEWATIRPYITDDEILCRGLCCVNFADGAHGTFLVEQVSKPSPAAREVLRVIKETGV